jgi:hypothetical protein
MRAGGKLAAFVLFVSSTALGWTQNVTCTYNDPSGDRDIYLTPPGPTGCGLTNLANGTGSVCMAC